MSDEPRDTFLMPMTWHLGIVKQWVNEWEKRLVSQWVRERVSESMSERKGQWVNEWEKVLVSQWVRERVSESLSEWKGNLKRCLEKDWIDNALSSTLIMLSLCWEGRREAPEIDSRTNSLSACNVSSSVTFAVEKTSTWFPIFLALICTQYARYCWLGTDNLSPICWYLSIKVYNEARGDIATFDIEVDFFYVWPEIFQTKDSRRADKVCG